MSTEGFDVVIVGAGSSGCVVAYRLVRDTGARVLLIEAGGPDSLPAIHNTDVPSTVSLWSEPSINWGYATEAQADLNGRSLPVARGKVWGGCSSINAMLYARGNPRDYDAWAEAGNTGWSYEEVLPYFKRAEDFEGGESHYRGAGGPLKVIYHDEPSPVSERLFAAGKELGYETRGPRFDYNAEEQCDTVFYYQATKTLDHHRTSTAVAFLYPIRDKSNFTLLSDAVVTRILFSGTRAVGVEYVKDGQTSQAMADQEVVICGGAYESPKLLMLSGIGGAAQLGAHGVPVLADLPGVGENLQEHMILGVCSLSKNLAPFVPTLIAETGLFTRTRPGSGDGPPDLQIKFANIKFVPPEYDREGDGFTLAPVVVQPESRGTITLRSSNPLDLAILQPNFLSSPADMDVFLSGIELVRALARCDPIAEFVKQEISPGPGLDSDEELRSFIRAAAGTLWHPVGTCKMGVDEDAVVDPDLKVRGIEGLRVADASIMPRIVSANTNAACVMIGEKAADLVAASGKGT